MDFHAYFKKLRELPDKRKKIVLWTIVGILGLIMGFFWIRTTTVRLSEIGNSLGQIQLPEIEMPSTDILQNVSPSDQPIFTEETADGEDEFGKEFVELSVWPDAGSFNLDDNSFYAKDLNTGQIIKIAANDETEIYKQEIIGEPGTIKKDYHDFPWLYSTLKNWEGPTWQFAIKGTIEGDHILAFEIYYQIQ